MMWENAEHIIYNIPEKTTHYSLLLTPRIFFGLATLQKPTAVVIKCMPFGDLSACEPGTSQDSQRIPRLAQVRFTASGLEVKLCGVTS